MGAEESSEGDLRTATTRGRHDTSEIVRVQGSKDSGREGMYRPYPSVSLDSAEIRSVDNLGVFKGEEHNGGV